MQPGTTALTAGALALGLVVGAYGLRPRNEAPVQHQTTCPSGSSAMARLELLFGASRRGQLPVDDAAWQSFVDAEVTPRFPDGLTVLEGAGQWRGSDGTLTKERTRVLLVWYDQAATRQADIDAIRAAYTARFGQESVMRVDDRTSCVTF